MKSIIKMSEEVATFEDIIAAKDNPQILLIDVRDPDEILDNGSIPSSINIPLQRLQSTLVNLSPEEFEEAYRTNKPSKQSPIIFICNSGNRSEEARNIALDLGFTNVKNYLGGWSDYSERMEEMLQKPNF